ncbi:MAG: MATE family efflux transporter, partial [Lachnospiraceae bacterium]|nr:MATE family efflux transporter [Lachnospiraceae bacterium]
VYLLGKQLLLLFLDAGETQIIGNAYYFLRINALFYFPLALVNIVRFLIQGMGFSKLAVFAGAFEMLARALAGFWLVPYFGFVAVCLASPLAWIFADAFLIPAFFHVRKKMEVILNSQKENA